eukprot:s1479_g1.t1
MQRQCQRLVLTVEWVCRRTGLDRPLLKSIIFRFLDTFPRLVVAGSLDGEVLLTRLGRLNAGSLLTGQQIRLSLSPGQAVHSVVVAKVGPSGERTIAAGSAEGSVRLFAEDGSLLLSFQAYSAQPVLSLQLGKVGAAGTIVLATATGGTVAREEGELFDAAHLWEFEDLRQVPRAACALQHGLGVNGIAMSGASCTIAALASGRVDQLHGAIERVLKIPTCVQNLIIACEDGSREIRSHELLSSLPLESCQNQLTVFNSWPKDPSETVEKLKAVSRSPTPQAAAAVARCLTFEDSCVQAAALQALSWMGKAGKQHAPEIAEKLQMELPRRYHYGLRLPTVEGRQQRAVAITAIVALSWLEEAGAAYAADILFYNWFWNSATARGAFDEMYQSESSATRLAAVKSLIARLEKHGFGPVEHDELDRRRSALPYICRAVFDESAEVHQLAGACLMRFVPPFCGEADIFTLGESILDQLLRFGDRFSGKSLPETVSSFCRDLAAKLDGYWPQYAGWQEGIDDEEDEESLEAGTQVATATVRYLRRRFQQWLAVSQASFGAIESAGMDLIEAFEFGLASPRWQVRRAAVESLIAIAPWGAHCVVGVISMRDKEKRKEVLEVMASFLAKYAEHVADPSRVRQCCLYVGYDDGYSDYSEECRQEWNAQWEDSLMRDKHGGFLKSHATRRARHNKQHGANASQGPSTIAKKKKWERRSKPAEVQNYSEIKKPGAGQQYHFPLFLHSKISQRDKEQDRQFKAAFLGCELFSLSLGLESESS